MGTLTAFRDNTGKITYTASGTGYTATSGDFSTGMYAVPWYADGPEAGNSPIINKTGTWTAFINTNFAQAYTLTVSVAVTSYWGGIQATSQCVIEYGANEGGSGTVKGPDGPRAGIFSWINDKGKTQIVGIGDGNGSIFGLKTVLSNQGYDKFLNIEPGDTKTYTINAIDPYGWSQSPENPSGSNYFLISDHDGTGTVTQPDSIKIPNGHPSTTQQGNGMTYQDSSSGPVTNGQTPPKGDPKGGNLVTGIANPTGSTATGSGTGTGNATEGTLGAGLAEVNANLKAIKQAIIAQGPNGGGTGGGTEVDLSGVESRLDTVNSNLETSNEHLEKVAGIAGRQAELEESAPDQAAMSGQGQAKAAEISALIPNLAEPPEEITVSGSKPNFSISFPAIMGGRTVDLDPFRADRFGGVVDWFRDACHWAAIVLFALWASSQVREWVKASAQIRQATGNAVVGGTGAQATALVAAGLMTVAIAAFIVALLAWLGGNFAIPALLGALGESPIAGLASGPAWMLNKCFPVSTIVSALVVRATWNLFAASIFGACSTVIRFIVP
jgi:hypothetical protein